jgi:hypothetical protein
LKAAEKETSDLICVWAQKAVEVEKALRQRWRESEMNKGRGALA